MANFIVNALAKLVGSKVEKDRKELQPYIGKVNIEFAKLREVSNDGLRQKTQDLKNYIQEKLKDLDSQIADLKKQIADNPQMGVLDQEKIFNKIDELGKEHDKQLEVVLEEILPQAFAIVKETARRFKENTELEVTVTDFDREISVRKDNVEIREGKAVWKNSWIAAGNRITWDMMHYDVQIIGGVVLHKGRVAEMATGEGKTLVASFPAFLNAIAGKGVHIVTVNDYLARRDSEWMAPLFEFHGLRVDCIDKHQPNSQARRNAYLADITYGTNNEFGFDYLRDNMVNSPDQLVQRKLHYAMVDEVDSVLIDDARTPLIIAGPVSKTGQEEMFYALKPRIERLVNAQKQIVNEFLTEAKRKIQAGDTKEGGLALFRAHRGLPKSKPLIKFLGETGMKALLQKTEAIYLADNQKLMPEADSPLYFTIEEKNNQIELTQKGLDLITTTSEDANFFVLPDIGSEIAKIENSTTLSLEDKAHQKENLITDYSIKAERIHIVNQLLKAYCMFEKDVEYIIVEGEVKIVDEQTGRVMEGRRYSDGLHQALEAKENVKIEQATQTYATVTLQNYFRMYHKLAGMTGTAETEAGELWEIYKLDVVVIPTNRPISRKDSNDLVFKTMREKFNAVIEEIVQLTEKGRPVLVGTTSVEISELLSRMLTMRKIKHQVLNAKQNQKEAEVVALAGLPGTVTIATNMAGRGTDIKLTAESKAAGGLAIIGTERHESRRVDRQLRGRAGRQGDPGTSQFFVSLEDQLMRLFGSDRIAKVMDRMGLKEGEVIQHSWVTKSIERAQKKVEENNFGMRKRLLEYDDVMNVQREQIYKRRRNALFGDRLQIDLYTMMYEVCKQTVESMQTPDNFENFELEFISTFGFTPDIQANEFNSKNTANCINKLYRQIVEHYRSKNQQLIEGLHSGLEAQYEATQGRFQNIGIPFGDGRKQIFLEVDFKKALETKGTEVIRELEKVATLAIIDQEWKEHLRDMDDLKQSVQMASYEQKDPLLIYKFESFQLFKTFITRVNKDIISFLMRSHVVVPEQEPQMVQEIKVQENQNKKIKMQKEEYISSASNEYYDPTPEPEVKLQPMKSQKIADRNQKVNVMYHDGKVLRDVKYKKVEEDLANNKCVLID
ncbi:MAG: preprotein translocase subunit SecA [Raineya sp.]|jgi:preprotein translocase subunit SecA|nr:preprotein translocase subunit SecA [Raineya sp.]